MFAFCKKAYVRCLEEIKLRNIGGMILIDFPRMSSTKKKLLHEKIINKKYPSFIKVIQRNDLPNDYGELSETN